MTGAGELLAETRAVTRRFGTHVAVDAVDLAVERGAIVGLLGANGAGKTTLIRMLLGLLRPSAGQVALFGRAPSRRSRARLGYVPQGLGLYRDLTVDENAQFSPHAFGVEPPALPPDLAAVRDRLVGDIGLGRQRRLAFLLSLSHRPELVVLDEPTSGVDPLSRRSFWDLIYALADGGTTVFVTTHYMEEAEYCHRLALMNRGKLIALDTPARLRAAHGEPILELRTKDGPRAVELLQNTPGVVQAGMFGRAVHVAVEDVAEARETLPTLLRAHGITLDGAEFPRIEPSLEDVFVSLVRAAGGAVAG